MSVHKFALALLLVGVTLQAASAGPVFSSGERAQGLRDGRGMGLAVAAENNGYPGPRHVLDAADALGLSPAQRAETSRLITLMKREAVPAAERLLADEAALEQLFKSRVATEATIKAVSDTAALSESALRVIHLKYHLKMIALLTPDQVRTYYARGGASHGAKGEGARDAHPH